MLLFALSLISAYLVKSFGQEKKAKEKHRETKLRKLETFHKEKVNLMLRTS